MELFCLMHNDCTSFRDKDKRHKEMNVKLNLIMSFSNTSCGGKHHLHNDERQGTRIGARVRHHHS